MIRLSELLGIDVPVVQAGMGGVAGPELAAAVAGAGAGGQLGLYRASAEEADALLAAAARLATRPIGVSLIPEVLDADGLVARVERVLAWRRVVSFVSFFGCAPTETCDRLRRAGVRVLVQVGSAVEAEVALAAGADALVVQGTEAGGHHRGPVCLAEAWDEVRRSATSTPLLVAGGMAGRGALDAALRLGAHGLLAGTAFICATESRAHPVYKAGVRTASASDTVVGTFFERGWAGRPHRVLQSPVTRGEVPADGRFVARRRAVDDARAVLIPRGSVAVPTADMTGRVEELAMYCGTGVDRVVESRPAAHIVHELASPA